MMKTDPESARAVGDMIVKNTYRTLMTRGMKGCYVYCTDAALADHLRSRLGSVGDEPASGRADPGSWAGTAASPSNFMPLRLVSRQQRDKGVAAAPVVDLRFAAGQLLRCAGS